MQYINGFDFVCLSETFLCFDLKHIMLKDFELYEAPARKLSRKGRCSGGVIVMVKKCYVKYVKRLNVTVDNMVILQLSKDLFKTDKDVVVINVYIPPPDSPVYSEPNTLIGIENIEQAMLELNDVVACDVYYLLCGDMNARTGNLNAAGNS